MGERLPIFLPRIAVVVVVALAASAGLTFAAGKNIQAASPAAAPTAPRKIETIVVPDVRNQAFVFAKGQLEDLGFAWRINGSVHGFAANTVVSQSPAAGTKLLNTGSPVVALTLARNGKYAQTGAPQDASPYTGPPSTRGGRSEGQVTGNERGYTMVEMLVVMSILSIVIAGLTTVFVSGGRAELDLNRRFQSQQQARLALDKIRVDLHCASSA